MIILEKLHYCGLESALRGMRNAMNSWHLADSTFDVYGRLIKLGENDARLLLSLARAGSSHRKVLRMFHVQMDITAPLYWWKDYDTYKVSTVANGCSTMHKIHEKEFTIDQFAHEYLDEPGLNLLKLKVEALNGYRRRYLDSNKKDTQAWHCMIQLLESSYMQKRTIDINYETALAIILDRRQHKLDEFKYATKFFIEELPFMEGIVKAVTTNTPISELVSEII